jgi:hypothetical protein
LPFEGPVELEFDMKTMHWKISSGTTIKSLKGDKPNRAGVFPGQEENDRVEVRHDPRKQIKARIAQLQGDYAKAIRTYLSVQLDELPAHLPLPEEVQERARNLPPDQRPKGLDKNGVIVGETPKREFLMNFRAAEDAKFWMGVCQLDQHEAETAEETLGAYLRRYGQGAGTWIVQAAHLRAVALAENKKFALAVQGITQLADALPESDFRRPTYELLSARWRLVRDAAKPSAEPAPQKESTASAKSDPAPAKPPASEKPPAPTRSSPAAPPSTTKTPAPPAATDAKSTTKPKTP